MKKQSYEKRKRDGGDQESKSKFFGKQDESRSDLSTGFVRR